MLPKMLPKCYNTGKKIRERHKNNYKLKFWTLCIPTRIALGLIVWFCSQIDQEYIEEIIAVLLLITSLFAVYRNAICIHDKTTWWSRKFEICIALSIFITSILALTKEIHTKWIAIILWIDVLWGSLNAIIHQ